VAVREVRGDHDAGRAHLALDVAVLVEPPVHEVLVVGHGDVERHDQAPGPPDLAAEGVVHVLPQHPAVLFMDTDGVPDRARLATGVGHHRVEVGDLAEAVTAELQRGGHHPEAPFADVERGPADVVGGDVPVGDDGMQPGQVMGVGAALLAAPVPDVGPAEPQAAVALRHQRRGIGPYVGEHQGQIGDPPPGQRRRQPRVPAEHLIALVPLVHGQVRLLARQVLPADDRVVGQRDDRAVGLAAAGVPADGQGFPVRARPRSPVRPAAPRAANAPAGGHRRRGILGRFSQLDRGEPPPGTDPPFTAQHRNDLAELGGCQRVKRMRRAHAVTPS